MGRHSRHLSIAGLLAALCMGVYAAGCGPVRPRRQAVVTPAPPKANGQRALALTGQLVEISPRDAGSPGAARAAEWIAAQAEALGCEVVIDEWREETVTGPLTFRNVLARLPGGDSRRRLLIGSHFDTKYLPDVDRFQGANDSGSSTGLLLELIRVLRDHWPTEGPALEFAFFDGEECQRAYGPRDGLHGSKRLAAQIAKAKTVDRYLAMILMDMVGDRDLSITLPLDTPPHLARAVFAAADRQGTRPAFGYAPGAILDDHVPFQKLGIPSVNIIDFQYGPRNAYWHTEADRMDKLSAESLETVGNVVLDLLWNLDDGWDPAE